MSSPSPRVHRPIPAMIVSLACHTTVVALLITGATRATLKKSHTSTLCCFVALQIAGGSRAQRLQLPAAPVSIDSSQRPSVQNPVTRAGSLRREHLQKASGTNAAAARPSDLGTNSVAGNGGDAQNTTPAFPVFSPNPAVHDLSLLPGIERQVVVDVQLNAYGEVVSEILVRGIGNALDQIVLDTVKTWRFQPATIDGKPVESADEVIVPFSSRYPVSEP